jgi:SAM-dependent methyltransferase
MPDDPYAIDARYYDLVHSQQSSEDVGLWLSFARRTGRPVLEAGTGTGRVAIELARAGCRVTGLDPSTAMLALAREKAAAAGVELDLVEGRLTEVDLPRDEFGLALLPADVFLYCEGGEEQVVSLFRLGETLAFDGILAVDLPGPAAWLDPATNGQPLLVFAGETEEGERLEAWQLHEDDLARQTRLLRMTYDVAGKDALVRRRVSEHRLRYVYRFEMEYLLHLGGLALLDVYGDYDLGPLTNDSERMIVTARRRAG